MDSNARGRYVVVGSDGKIIQKYQFVSTATGSAQHVPIMTIGPNCKLIPVRERVQNSNIVNANIIQNQGIAVVKPDNPHSIIIEKQLLTVEKQQGAVLNQVISQPEEKIKLIPVRQRIQNSNIVNASIIQNQEISGVKTEIPHGVIIEKQQLTVEKQQGTALNQEISQPEEKLRGDREVECAKSCRACCNIDDADFEDKKTSSQANTSSTTTTTRTWGCSRCGATGTEAMGTEGTPSGETGDVGDAKSGNSFPLVLGLVPATNIKADCPPKGRFQCKVCFKLFTQKVNLTTHERIHLGERPYQCKVCLKAFTQQSNLVTHERIHTGERPYQCQVCLKRFTQRQNLTAHERIRLGERPFRCGVCQKAFTQRQNLVAHERIHLGERPYQCQVCFKSFTQQQNLTAHERIHSGFRQFSCSVCTKSFTQEQNLTKHMLTHTGEKPYTCQYCSKSFAQQSNLTTHERTHLVGNSSSIEGADRERKVFVYTEEQLSSSQIETQQTEAEIVQTDMNSVYPAQSS